MSLKYKRKVSSQGVMKTSNWHSYLGSFVLSEVGKNNSNLLVTKNTAECYHMGESLDLIYG